MKSKSFNQPRFVIATVLLSVFSLCACTVLQAEPLSIVTLGDSIAAGEGINYGYTYLTSGLLNRWVGGVVDPHWAGEYQLCHQSDKAYSNIVATDLGASLATFACTGASYDNGIIAERKSNGTVYRPAEFGNWPLREHLNPDYDAAKPDVVLVTLGANDVDFSAIVEYCANPFAAAKQVEAAIAEGAEPRTAARKSLVPALRSLEKTGEPQPPDDFSLLHCTESNPGSVVKRLFWDRLPQVEKNFKALVKAIKERGAAHSKVPQIVWTTYPDPLPQPSESDWCLDVGDLFPVQREYLTSLLVRMNQLIIDSVGRMEGVTIADISQVLDGHEWCTSDPWAYGLSALLLNPETQAPFHPTPAGQKAIAVVVIKAVSLQNISRMRDRL